MRSNLTAATASVEALRGRLKPEHDALVAAVLNLADVLDSEVASDRLWREYRAALASLLEAASDTGGEDDADDAFASAVRTPMGNGAHPN